MKNRVVFLLIGLLMFGANVFAAGDLIVNGKVGIGTTVAPSAKLGIETDANGLDVDITQSSAASAVGGKYTIGVDGSTKVYVTTGFNSLIKHIGTSSPLPATRAAIASVQFRSPTPGSSTFSFIRGFDLEIRDMAENARDYSGDELSMFRTGGAFEGTGTITAADVTGAAIDDIINNGKLVATNVYGMKVEKQTAGQYNYGIVLNGDGAGADVVFGDSGGTRPRIYSDAGFIYADDAFGSHTKISPHDPETGEWVYYSKNLRTGKVVRVNMEKLVRAVEKITGETFMVETFEEIE